MRPCPPYSRGTQIAGEAGVEEHALHLAVARDRGQLLLVGALVAEGHQGRPDGLQVGSRIHARARARKASSVSSLVGAHAGLLLGLDEVGEAPAVLARACRSSARFTVCRRRKRWRSCSKVTPMPPCICTQSWSSSAPYWPM